MRNSSVKKSAYETLLKNKILSAFLVLLIIGFVLSILIPPQILKYIIDYNFAKKTSDGLIGTAVFYVLIVFLIGILDFLKEAILT
ncbi:MAG: ABC transporter ATP-binding protein, partial [Sedimentibacter sp.]